jgi:hypothetical protein
MAMAALVLICGNTYKLLVSSSSWSIGQLEVRFKFESDDFRSDFGFMDRKLEVVLKSSQVGEQEAFSRAVPVQQPADTRLRYPFTN